MFFWRKRKVGGNGSGNGGPNGKANRRSECAIQEVDRLQRVYMGYVSLDVLDPFGVDGRPMLPLATNRTNASRRDTQ